MNEALEGVKGCMGRTRNPKIPQSIAYATVPRSPVWTMQLSLSVGGGSNFKVHHQIKKYPSTSGIHLQVISRQGGKGAVRVSRIGGARNARCSLISPNDLGEVTRNLGGSLWCLKYAYEYLENAI